MSGQQASAAKGRLQRRLGRNSVIALPYVWLLLFFLLPFVFVLKISLAEADIAIPPIRRCWNGSTTPPSPSSSPLRNTSCCSKTGSISPPI